MTRRLDRAEQAARTIGPDRDTVAAARARLVAEVVAIARGEPVEHDQAAAAIVRADARRRGIDLDDPEVEAAMRAEVVDALYQP